MSVSRAISCVAAPMAILGLALAGCAGGPDGVSNVGLVAGGGSCKSLKRELGRYEARGIQYKADAANRGKRLSSKQRADVNRYNKLLDAYLGNKCHV